MVFRRATGCLARERSLVLSIAKPIASRTSTSSCVYVDTKPFSDKWFAGIPRYTARLTMALAAHLPVRFFDEYQEVLLPQHLNWSQDQDLEYWGRQVWQGRRQPLSTPPANSIGLYCAPRPSRRIFPFEVSVLHDLCPMVVPWAFPAAARDGFRKFLTENIPASDVVLSDSHSTKTDASWFSSLDPERIVVASPGPSLCVETHLHPGRVARADRIGLVVSTIEPRKNAGFLFDWFQKTTLLPPDMELWWVGKLGWMTSRRSSSGEPTPLAGAGSGSWGTFPTLASATSTSRPVGRSTHRVMKASACRSSTRCGTVRQYSRVAPVPWVNLTTRASFSSTPMTRRRWTWRGNGFKLPSPSRSHGLGWMTFTTGTS